MRFRAALDSAQGDERLELLTQIARTFSLRGQFDEAHKQLSEVERQLSSASPPARIRYLLERGRTFNSAGEKEKARDLFTEAWELAQAVHKEGLAVDAAHMLAITYSGDLAGYYLEPARPGSCPFLPGSKSTRPDPSNAQ